MALTTFLLAATLCLGHVSIWIWVYNRLHASRLPSRLVQRLEKWTIVAAVATCGLLAVVLLTSGPVGIASRDGPAGWLLNAWCFACSVALAYVVLAWGMRQGGDPAAGRLVRNDTVCLEVASILGQRPVGDRLTRLCDAIPGNQILQIHAHHKILRIARLPPELDGLRIAQVTDLHMTGQLTRAFFDVAVEQVNRWEADAVMITGDLVDRAACIAWIPHTLGQLRGRYGVYAILGNHDQRLEDVGVLRQSLRDCGIEDLGGRCLTTHLRGVPVLLAGNEDPWFPPAPQIAAPDTTPRPFSILLSHSPDQLPWARRHGFDLMLAGHTHGGQIRLPIVGPIICPSRYGVRYASGVFDVPPTLLHVSRGLSGVQPLRFHCPPELTLLELRCPVPQVTVH
jgi:uncharacterized protein